MKIWPQMLILLSGATLILVGLIDVGVRGYEEVFSAQSPSFQVQQQQQQQVNAPGVSFQVKTRFPGIELIAIGAVLEIVGFLGAQPWKGDKISN